MNKLEIPAKVIKPSTPRYLYSVSLGKDLLERVRNHREINWSAFFRQQVEQALDQLEAETNE